MIQTTLNRIEALLGSGYRDCESPSLRLNKFVHLGDDKTAAKDEQGTKRRELEGVVSAHHNHAMRIPDFQPKGTRTIVARLEGRLMVNQAGGILENAGLCLHPFFGDPYIPGSAVKGVTRHTAWCEWNGIPDDREEEKVRVAKKIARIFGYPTQSDKLDAYLVAHGWEDCATSGQVCFFAAIPLKKPELVMDIVTCHHKDYYRKKEKMAFDDEAPNPQFFPAVEAGTAFKFSFLVLKDTVKSEDVEKWLKEAISDYGVGAKTSAGYGWFDTDSKWGEQVEADLQRERAANEQKCHMDQFKATDEALKRDYSDADILEGEGLRLYKQMEGLFPTLSQEQQKTARGILDSWKKRLPKISTLDQLREEWSEQKIKAIVRGASIKGFPRLKDEKKKDVVLLLRESEGIGAQVWAEIKTGQKGDIAKAVDEIRGYCKTALELGKMPK